MEGIDRTIGKSDGGFLCICSYNIYKLYCDIVLSDHLAAICHLMSATHHTSTGVNLGQILGCSLGVDRRWWGLQTANTRG